MDTKTLYRAILNEHNINPSHKVPMEDASYSQLGVNPSCGDEITLNVKITGDVISDATFTGSGCAVSQASCDMMIDLIKGKSIDESKRLNDLFMRMITGSASSEELADLDEAAALIDVAKMPSRVKCAVLGWRTLNEIIDKNIKTGSNSNCASCSNVSCCTNAAQQTKK